MKIAVYAFANTAYFFERLIATSRDSIEWSVLLPRWHHRERFRELLPAEQTLYLYEDFDRRYETTDIAGAFDFSPGADSEFVCLAKDKGGYRNLDQGEQLRRAATVTRIYREFLERVRPDYLVFPDVEVVDGFLLLSLCRQLDITPIYYVGMRTLGGGFFSEDCYETLPAYFGGCDEGHRAGARRCLEAFGAGHPFDDVAPPEAPAVAVAPLWRRAPRAVRMHFRHERRYAGEDGWLMRIKASVQRPLNRYRRWYFRNAQLGLFDIVSDDQPLPQDFVLYALQYTPESSINGLEPYYIDQSRAIDLLLGGLPSGHRLLVKEHPAIVGVRDSAYYRELKKKPGVLLVAPHVNTRRLIGRAALVASVTGTMGLESFMLGRSGLQFGRNFFAHLCSKAGGPPDMPSLMRTAMATDWPHEDQVEALARLLAVRYPILLSDPLVDPRVLSDENVQAFLQALRDHVERLRQMRATEVPQQ